MSVRINEGYVDMFKKIASGLGGGKKQPQDEKEEPTEIPDNWEPKDNTKVKYNNKEYRFSSLNDRWLFRNEIIKDQELINALNLEAYKLDPTSKKFQTTNQQSTKNPVLQQTDQQIDYNKLYNNIKSINTKDIDQLSKFQIKIYDSLRSDNQFTSKLNELLKFYRENKIVKQNTSSFPKIIIDYTIIETIHFYLNWLDSVERGTERENMMVQHGTTVFNSFVNRYNEPNIQNKIKGLLINKATEVYNFIKDKASKQEPKKTQTAQQSVVQTPTPQVTNQQQSSNNKNKQIDYISLYNSIDENEKNLNNINDIKNFATKIREFFEKNFNFFDNHENLLREYYKKEKQFNKLDQKNDSVIYYFILNNEITDELYSRLKEQLDIAYEHFSDQENNVSNHKQINEFISDNYQAILINIEDKAKNQPKANQINESLIRRWKVLANIK